MAGLWLAFGLLTRLRVPEVGEVGNRERAAAVGWFPLVGLVIGLAMWAADTAARMLYGPLVAAAVAVAAGLALSGGLHFEGLLDTCDGCIAPLDRERRLEVMRDPRVGAFGVVFGAMALLLKILLIAELLGRARYCGLVLAPVLGRWAMCYAVLQAPAARDGGMGAAFAQQGGLPSWLRATAITAGCVFWLLPSLRAAAVLVVVFVAAAWLVARLTRLLGGLTGDTYGAVCEVCELVALAMVGGLARLAF